MCDSINISHDDITARDTKFKGELILKKGKKVQILIYAIMALVALLYVFETAVNLSPLYADGALFWCVIVFAYTFVWSLFKVGTSLSAVFKQKDEQGRPILDFSAISFKSFPKWAKILLVTPWVLFFVVSLSSTVIFNAKAYRDQLGNSQVQTFSSDVQPMDLSQLPIVDKYLAGKLADKKLGEKPSLGSQVSLGVPTIQRVNGELVWAVPLHHSGVFKWLTNLSGSAGYITVSATNVNDVQFVDDYKIKFQPNSYLLHDLSRWTRFTAAPFTGITDFSFELDDNGVPYWIVTTYKNLRGFALPEATGVVIVNASTGETQKLGIDEVPEWVDRVQPEYFIRGQIDNQGEYVHGFLNFSDKDKFKASSGQAIVYNNNKCYLFTGLTSVGNDESSIGFMMVDMVTKEPLLYQMNGATEGSAQSSAQGKVQHLGYLASFPLIVNADGNPTYFMTLKDKEGLIKQYAMVSVKNYSIVAVGETINQTYKNYQQSMRQSGTSESLTPIGNEQGEALGVVKRIEGQFDGQQMQYFIIIEGYEDKIFIAEAGVSSELPLTRDGDNIKLSYYKIVNESPIVEVSIFDNLEFKQK